jgi:hypothetical protein
MRQHQSELLATSQAACSAGIDLDDHVQELVELPALLTTRKSSLLALKTLEVCGCLRRGACVRAAVLQVR